MAFEGAGQWPFAGRSRKGRGGAGLPTFESILDAHPDSLFITDAEGVVLWLNRRAADRFGVVALQAVGRDVTFVAGPYAAQAEGRAVAELAAAGNGTAETTVFGADGCPFPCLVRASLLDEADPNGPRLLALADDRGMARLRAELLLKVETAQRERAALRAALDALEDVALVVDDCDRLLLANAAAARVFSVSEQDWAGRPITELPLPSLFRGAWLTFLASRRPNQAQTARVLVNGEARTFLVRLARATSLAGAPLASVLVARDLTRFVEPDRRKFDFLRDASHELKTPLASIHGFAETLAMEPDLERDTRCEFAAIIRDEAARLAALVDRLLEVSHFDSGTIAIERKQTDVAALLRETAAALTDEARRRGAPIEVCAPPEGAVALVDPPLMQRAFLQLLSNAIAHGPSPRGVRAELRPQVGRVELEIRDFGPAVPAEDLERIFDPFYRVLGEEKSGSEGGIGMGLALCRQIVERHGGKVRAELPAEAGLRIVVELPNS